MRFVDCQGLAGHGTSLGAVQAGFEMIHRCSLPGGFGDAAVDSNRVLLNFDGDMEVGVQEEWTPQKNVGLVWGTPPCSGFSLMNTTAAVAKNKGVDAPANARGAGSAINMCQRELVRYASRCHGTDGRLGADIVSFECVQGAFSQGLDLMREYWQMLMQATGRDYDLVHVKMAVAAIGGAQFRHRYFWIAHRSDLKFGISPETVTRMTTLEDAIGDLLAVEESWDPQPYPTAPLSDYQVKLRGTEILEHMSLGGGDGEDAHAGTQKSIQSMLPLLPYWEEGKAIHTATRNFIAANGLDALPEHLKKRWQEDKQFYKGFMWPFRLGWDEPTGVLTGGCAGAMLHPTEDRFLTIRELSRVMGVPDDWSWGAARNVGQAGSWIGKCCTTGSGKWAADAMMAALDGNPQDTDHEFWHRDHYKKTKLDLAPGESVFDITNEYKKASNYYRHSR